ncbi:hypothetical protein BCR37DRAFT_86572 [Protomyces lactucae-debilis]|uniref:NYN domain-containing protein n=1 Tax=Protomyces lactucae-debilis TaxID=2754530 RepID=A0A1Y2F685_PROLT|nr:uncharacterized protein BCR37DRAFT_86572 [Protomyces lactucae-debilis]ORY79383.1 hypothetical protein BCR37DRAFT_86572 [Protomyces lactucae-debilis]
MRASHEQPRRQVQDLCKALEAAPLHKSQEAEDTGFVALFRALGCNDVDRANVDAVLSQPVPPVQVSGGPSTEETQEKSKEATRVSEATRATPTITEDVMVQLDKALERFTRTTSKRPERPQMTTSARFASLDAKLAVLDKTRRAASEALARHIFVDSSNIYCGFQAAIQHLYQQDGYKDYRCSPRVPLDMAALDRILDRSKAARVKTLVGSSPLLQDWQQAALLDYEVSILARVPVAVEKEQPDGKKRTVTVLKEQGVDELLHLKMHESLLSHEPGVLVLASGDANAAQFSQGSFFKIALSALGLGWECEVVSFASGLSALWQEPNLLKLFAKSFRVVLLDDFLLELEQT